MAEEAEIKPDPGFVYVVQMEGLPIYKIGRSVDVPRRMSEFGILLPFPYRLVFAHRAERVRWAEGVLHDEYAHVRSNGEWFELAPNDLTRVRYLLLYWQAVELFKRLLFICARHANAACEFYQKNGHIPHPSYMERTGSVVALAARRVERRAEYCDRLHRFSSTDAPEEVEGVQ